MIDWLKWFFWTSRRCKHVRGPGLLRDFGRCKVIYCEKCGKCLDII
jgi:hypothetical protein